MRYNIKALAELSKISVRTLHYYDQIGLLTPSIRMGGHRYYGHKELMLLGEILFCKEMGLSLEKIKIVLDSSSTSKMYILSAQKQKLEKEVERLKKVCESIDKTIDYYKGKKMSAQEIRQHFQNCENRMKEMDEIFENTFGKGSLKKVDKIAKEISKEEIEGYAEKSKELGSRLVSAINENLPASSLEVQSLMEEIFAISSRFHSITKNEYLLSRNHLKTASQVQEYYFALHPKLPEFVYEAMGIFADRFFTEEK